jgi:hypothetical protein
MNYGFEEASFEYFESCNFSRENTNRDVSVFMHKGHDLPCDVKIMRSQQSYQELCQVHFCRTMFVDIADTTVPNLIYVKKNNVN